MGNAIGGDGRKEDLGMNEGRRGFFFLLCTCLFVNEREGKMMTKVGGVHIQRACAIFYLLTLIK